jgi:ATP-dependent Clp protease adaptor protein ClpS
VKISPKIRFDYEKLVLLWIPSIRRMVKEKVKPVKHQKGLSQNKSLLILFNDEINSFDFVIETLIEVCRHDPLQAEQCTWIAHYKGKCDVKAGLFSELKPMHDEMSNRGLTVTIEK